MAWLPWHVLSQRAVVWSGFLLDKIEPMCKRFACFCLGYPMDLLQADPGVLLTFGAVIVAAGVVGGLLAGMLGVGGGIIIVPVLYQVLGMVDVAEAVRMKVAVATSLGTIIATSALSIRSHYARGAVDLDLLKSWGVPIFLGVVAGTAYGGVADGRILTAVFAVVALLIALQMAFTSQGGKRRDGFPNNAAKAFSGLVVGAVSALMGIGGGTLSVPILVRYGFDIRHAVGTASAIGFIIAIPATLGYMISGYGVEMLPPFSLGYFNVAAALVLVPLTMTFAPVGARIAHSIPRRALQLCFALFLGLTASSMFYDLLKSA